MFFFKKKQINGVETHQFSHLFPFQVSLVQFHLYGGFQWQKQVITITKSFKEAINVKHCI